MPRPEFLRRDSGTSSTRSCLKACSSLDFTNDQDQSSGQMTPGGTRKCVAFCSNELEQIFFADEWDRTPTEVSQKLSYGDVLELKAIQRSLPMAYQPPDPLSKRPHSTILKKVPVGLLPLMCDQETYMKPPLPLLASATAATVPHSALAELAEIPSRPSSSARDSPPTPSANCKHFNNLQWVQLLPEYHNQPTRKVSPPVSPSTPPPSAPNIASPTPTKNGTRQRPHFAFLPLLDPVPVESAPSTPTEVALPPPSPTPTDEHEHELDPGLTTDETESDSHDELSSQQDDSSVSTPTLSSASRSRTPSPVEVELEPPNMLMCEPHSPFMRTHHEPRPSHLRTDCTPSILGFDQVTEEPKQQLKHESQAETTVEPDACEFLFNYDDDCDIEPSLSRRPTPNAMAIMSARGLGGYDYRRGSSNRVYPTSGHNQKISVSPYNPVLARSQGNNGRQWSLGAHR